MEQTHPSQMLVQRQHERLRQRRNAALVALRISDEQLPVGEVDVLHAQHQAFDLPQPRPIERARAQPAHAGQASEQLPHLVRGQHRRQTYRPLRPHHVVRPRPILLQDRLGEKQQRRQPLILRRCRDSAFGRELAERRGDLGRAHVGRMLLAMEDDEPSNPHPVRLLRPAAIVARADRRRESVD